MKNSETFKVAAQGDREIVMTRVFDAPRRLVWDAHTKPDLVKRWLLGPPGWSMPVCEIDLRVGGKWRWVILTNSGFEVAFHGEYRELVPNERIVYTEVYEGVPNGEEDAAVITLTLAEAAGRTVMS